MKKDNSIHWDFIVVLLVIVVLFMAMMVPNRGCHHGKPWEAEVKSHCHTLQIALERYYVDHNEYPPYLIGGDIDGWEAWHDQWDGVNDTAIGDGRIASNDNVVDPLIDMGYLLSYPSNPFVNDGRTIIRATSLTASRNEGDGDPRFGMKGNVMGMVLDDPNYFGGSLRLNPEQWSEIETRRTLDHGDYMNVPDGFSKNGTGMYYTFGGRSDRTEEEEEFVLSLRQGNFFYRAIPGSFDNADIRIPVYESCRHYILGGFGTDINPGMDVIRMERYDRDGNHLEWQQLRTVSGESLFCGYGYGSGNEETEFGLPAVFGGGDNWNGPVFPFIDETGEIIYGAPDGINDGVIIVFHDEPDIRPILPINQSDLSQVTPEIGVIEQ